MNLDDFTNFLFHNASASTSTSAEIVNMPENCFEMVKEYTAPPAGKDFYRILSITQLNDEEIIVDFANEIRILRISDFSVVCSIKTKQPMRSCIVIKSRFLVAGMENGLINVYQIKEDYPKIQEFQEEMQSRGFSYRNGVLLHALFDDRFIVYKVSQTTITIWLTIEIKSVQFCQFLSNKHFVVGTYGRGMFQYINRRSGIVMRNVRKLFGYSKIGKAVKLSKDKYLIYDWDGCKYYVFNSKKQSAYLYANRQPKRISQLTGNNNALTGERIYDDFRVAKFSKGPNMKSKLETFPFVLTREGQGFVLMNIYNKETKIVQSAEIQGLLPQKMFRVRLKNCEPNQTDYTEFMGTKSGAQNSLMNFRIHHSLI